jgi:hypothetical protein
MYAPASPTTQVSIDVARLGLEALWDHATRSSGLYLGVV